MKRKRTLEEALKEVRELAKKFKKKNGKSHLKLSNNDFNLWIVNTLINQDGRIIKLEATVKILSALFCGLLIKIIMF